MKRVLMLVIAVVMAALTACGGGSSENSGDKSSGSGAKGAVDTDGSIVIAHPTGMAAWDIAQSRGGPETELQGLVYDRLVHVTADGAPSPGLAESWEFGADAKSITFTLKSGVTFTDGTEFDSSVVKANIERLKGEGTTTAGQLMNITEVQTPDPSTVTFQLANPDTGVLLLMGDRFGMQMSPETFGGEITEPVGSGMFSLVSQQPGTTYEFTRNDDYWDAEVVQVKDVVVNVVADPKARMNAVRSGQADLTMVDAASVAEAESISNAAVTELPTIGVKTVYLNQALVPEFKDERVRKALSLAIDREAIVSSLLKGVGEPASQMIPPIAPGYNDALDGTPRDVDAAKALMEEAGVTGLSFDLAVQPPDTLQAEALQSQWKEIGVDVKIKTIDSFALGQAVWTDKTEEAGLVTFSGRLDPSFTMALNYLPGAPMNPGNFENAKLSELIKSAQAETDESARFDLLAQATELAAESPQGALPVFTITNGLLAGERLQGVQAHYLGFPRLDGVGVTK